MEQLRGCEHHGASRGRELRRVAEANNRGQAMPRDPNHARSHAHWASSLKIKGDLIFSSGHIFLKLIKYLCC